MTIERFLEIANSAVGLCADDAAFRELVGPGETPAMQLALAKKSTCALFVRGCLSKVLLERFVGKKIRDEVGTEPLPRELCAPYRDGMAVANLVEVLHRAGRDPERITRGSVVIVGKERGTHVLIVEAIERDGWPDGTYELIAIEAGQRDANGRQCVVRRKHEIVGGFDCAYEKEDPGGKWILKSSARPVSHVLDSRALLEGEAT